MFVLIRFRKVVRFLYSQQLALIFCDLGSYFLLSTDGELFIHAKATLNESYTFLSSQSYQGYKVILYKKHVFKLLDLSS